MLNISPKERIAIYFFYDEYGKVDNYVINFLNGLKKVADRIIFVVNGLLDKDSEKKIKQITDEILIRENIGLDAWAYKDAFNYVGFSKLSEYEEVIYCNSTTFGPVYPFEEMFNKMCLNEDLDFWGITYHPDLMTKDTLNPLGYIPKHIQHYFVVYRKRFTKTKDLKDYWDNLPPINNYAETVGLHETVFTKHFSDLGYKWDTYLNYSENEETTNYILMYEPLKSIVKYRSPVIKRKVFFLEKRFVTSNSIGERVINLLDFLDDNNLYNTDLIYENIIRTTNQNEFVDNFNFWYVLPEKYVIPIEKNVEYKNIKASLVVFLTKEENENYLKVLANKIPKNLDIQVIRINKNDDNTFEFIIESLKDIQNKYDYLCLVNDRITRDSLFSTSERSIREVDFRSVLASKEYAVNVMNLFEQNKWLGLLLPQRSLVAGKAKNVSKRWADIYLELLELKRTLGLNVQITKDAYPITNSGYCWIKGDILKRVLAYKWDKIPWTNNTYTAIQCVLPYVIQNEGLSFGYITTDKIVGQQLSSLTYYMKRAREDNSKEIIKEKLNGL